MAGEQSNQTNEFRFPELMTEPFKTFLFTSIQIVTFFNDFRAAFLGRDLVLLAQFRDYLVENRVTKTESGEDIEDINKYAVEQMNLGMRTAQTVFEQHGLFLLQTMHARSFDAFLSYLTDLLELIYRTQTAKLNLDDDTDLASFVQELINNHKDKVSLGNRENLYAEYNKRLNLPLFETKADREREVWIAEVRNAIAHQRGVATARFKQRVHNPPVEVNEGKFIPLSIDRVSTDLEFLTRVLIDLDERAATKFSLPRESNPFGPSGQQEVSESDPGFTPTTLVEEEPAPEA